MQPLPWMFVVLSENLFCSLEEFATMKIHCQYLRMMKREAGYLNFIKSHALFFNISVVAIEGGDNDELVLNTPTAEIQSEMQQVSCRTRRQSTAPQNSWQGGKERDQQSCQKD